MNFFQANLNLSKMTKKNTLDELKKLKRDSFMAKSVLIDTYDGDVEAYLKSLEDYKILLLDRLKVLQGEELEAYSM